MDGASPHARKGASGQGRGGEHPLGLACMQRGTADGASPCEHRGAGSQGRGEGIGAASRASLHAEEDSQRGQPYVCRSLDDQGRAVGRVVGERKGGG